MIELNSQKYLIRASFFSLVELSLLADMFEKHCVPAATNAEVNKESLAQTLLKMKASEKTGKLNVVIYDASPVGFYWEMNGKVQALWVDPSHRNQGIEERLPLDN